MHNLASSLNLLGQSGSTQVWRLLTLQDYNTRVVLLGTVILGLTAGLLGVYLLLRRRALIGDAIAHATLPGVALTFLVLTSLGLEKSLPFLLLGAAISGALGGASVLVLRHIAKVREDAALGIVLSVYFGAGTALLTIAQKSGNAAGLTSFIYGKAAAMTTESVWLAALAAVVVTTVILLLGKELKLLCFDAELAQSQGWPVIFLDGILIGLVVAVTIVGLQAVGLILVIALLVTPAASARFWTHNLNRMLLISATIGALSCGAGTLISASMERVPSGPAIVLTACGFFLLSFMFGWQRGVVWTVARFWQLRQDHDFQHVLRSIYELLESSGALPNTARELKSTEPVPIAAVCRHRAWSNKKVRQIAARMASSDLVVASYHDTIQLTPRGLLRAAATVRDHRLLELYMVDHAQAQVDEADRTADYLEHALLPEHLAELSGKLHTNPIEPVPPSPHPLEGG